MSSKITRYSVLEILVVLALLGILSTLAFLQLRKSRTDFERQNIVREFKNYLERARFDSVKRRAVTNAEMATIVLNGPSSFSATIDFDVKRHIIPAETRTVNFSQRSPTQISVSDTLNYPVTIRFDRRGQATAVDAANNAVTPVFRICSDCSVGSTNVSYLSISASGTIADTTTAPGTLPPPAITSANTSLNCYVLISNSNSACINF